MEDQIKELNKTHEQMHQRICIMKENAKNIDDLALKHNIEIWRKIENYLNYSISSLGRIRNDNFNNILKTHKNKDGYYYIKLYNSNKAKKFAIHRLVAVAFVENRHNKSCVDHINNNQTDNNVKNLRFATNQENQFNQSMSRKNTSGIKGVCYHKRDKRWRAQITFNGKKLHIGRFITIEEAIEARIKKAKELFGEYINGCEI